MNKLIKERMRVSSKHRVLVNQLMEVLHIVIFNLNIDVLCLNISEN